eukprot:2229966-Rhodomonas_salina.1
MSGDLFQFDVDVAPGQPLVPYHPPALLAELAQQCCAIGQAFQVGEDLLTEEVSDPDFKFGGIAGHKSYGHEMQRLYSHHEWLTGEPIMMVCSYFCEFFGWIFTTSNWARHASSGVIFLNEWFHKWACDRDPRLQRKSRVDLENNSQWHQVVPDSVRAPQVGRISSISLMDQSSAWSCPSTSPTPTGWHVASMSNTSG